MEKSNFLLLQYDTKSICACKILVISSSYNNAAFFAVAGANNFGSLHASPAAVGPMTGGGGVGSSRSSEISIAKGNLSPPDLLMKKQLSLSHM